MAHVWLVSLADKVTGLSLGIVNIYLGTRGLLEGVKVLATEVSMFRRPLFPPNPERCALVQRNSSMLPFVFIVLVTCLCRSMDLLSITGPIGVNLRISMRICEHLKAGH
jgi:hypothetical protein